MPIAFSEYLKALREKRGIGLVALGEKIEFNPGYLSRVEHGKVQPSDRLLRALARELDDLGLYNAAGKAIPEELFPHRKDYQCLTYDEFTKTYPPLDPWARYGKDEIPGILKDSEYDPSRINEEYRIRPVEVYLYPPLRKKISDLYIVMEQDSRRKIDSFITAEVKMKRASYLEGRAFGIIEAYEMLRKVQNENGDYALLAAFYEPEIARAIADFIKIQKELNPNKFITMEMGAGKTSSFMRKFSLSRYSKKQQGKKGAPPDK